MALTSRRKDISGEEPVHMMLDWVKHRDEEDGEEDLHKLNAADDEIH